MSAFDIPESFSLEPDAPPKPKPQAYDLATGPKRSSNKGNQVKRHIPKEQEGEPVVAPTRNWKEGGEYKYPPAMRINVDRAHACQPPLIALTNAEGVEE